MTVGARWRPVGRRDATHLASDPVWRLLGAPPPRTPAPYSNPATPRCPLPRPPLGDRDQGSGTAAREVKEAPGFGIASRAPC